MPSIFPWRETGVVLKIFHQSIDWWIWSGKNYGKNWGWTVNRVFDHEFLCQINGQREMCDWRCASIFRGAWLWAEMKCWGLASQWEKKNAYTTSSKIHQGCHCFYCFLIRFSIAALFQKFKTGTTDILGMPYLLQNFFGPNLRIRAPWPMDFSESQGMLPW